MRKLALRIGLRYLLGVVNKYLRKAQKGGQLKEVKANLTKYGQYLRDVSSITGSVAVKCDTIVARLADGKLDKAEAEATIAEITVLAKDIKRRLK